MHMGRTRSRDPDLKNYPGLNRKGGAYYFGRAWKPLGSDKAEAIRQYHLIHGAKDSRRTVSTLIDACIPSWEGLADNTKRSYTRMAEIIRKHFGSAPVEQVKTSHVRRFLDLHPKKPYARNVVILFGSMMSKAVGWDWRAENPCREVKKGNVSRRKRYLSDAEFVAIREKVSPPHQIAMDLAYKFDLAVGEVVSIKLANIDAEEMRVWRAKTKKWIVITLTPDAREIISRAKALRRPVRSLYLLTSPAGTPYKAATVSGAIRRAARAIGIKDARFHDIRAKSASDEQETAQGRLGHADSRTTQIYLRKPLPVSPIRRKL